jgi:signal transduction histidine kinase
LLDEAFARRRHEFRDGRSCLYIPTASVREVVVILDAPRPLSDTDRTLVEVFCARLSLAFDNVGLFDKLKQANVHLERRVERRNRELRTAKERLEEQWNLLRRANAFKSEVLGTVAHDLKNPLGVILGRTEILTELLTGADTPEAALAQIEHIRGSARRLTDMVDSLIQDAMRDALDISVKPSLFDLGELVREVLEANRGPAERKEQTIAVSVQPDLMVSGDQERLREAIDNLVSNAVKYSPIGGQIAVSAKRAGGEVVVRVQDDGPGLSPEDAGRVFGRFQRLSAKPTGGETSTGLGLSITKQIVDLHNGRIFVDTAGPGEGAVFVIALPDRNSAAEP